jgi:carbon monoxide dehydrogenase subunit G
MGRVGASLQIPYPPDQVFRVATRIEDLSRWLPEVVSAELLDPELAVGSRVRLRLSGAAAGAEVVGTVRQLRAPSTLAIGGQGGPLTVEVRTRLQPVGEAATRISLEIDLSTSPLLGFIAREAERRINAELPASLERFRALMDAEPG